MLSRVELLLDEDVLAAFLETASKTGRSLEETVNDVLRSFVKERRKEVVAKPVDGC